MGLKFKLSVITLPIFSVLVFRLYFLLSLPPIPILENTWWGTGDPENEDETIYPFKINISEQELNDFYLRLNNTRQFLPPLEYTQHQYGFNSKLLQNITSFWKSKYNWKKTEEFLNRYPQFTTNIQGLKLHYVHVKPTDVKGLEVLPLLLLNGWPSSFREFYGVIPFLTTPRDDSAFVFEVIIPSLPGFGFSQAPIRPGLGAAQMALLFKNFMHRLGFQKFYLQGGDLGGLVIQHMGVLYPDVLLGMHMNMCVLITPKSIMKWLIFALHPRWFVKKEHLDRMFPVSKVLSNLITETGYLHIQSSKPDTLGVALNESPIGLAAYLLEKFIFPTNEEYVDREDGGLLEKYDYTSLLDNVMIYWWTQSIQTTFRFYAEIFNKEHMGLGIMRQPITVPSACARFKHDFYTLNEALDEVYTNLVHLTYYDGGHFPAMECPEVLANDVFIAVEKFRSFLRQRT